MTNNNKSTSNANPQYPGQPVLVHKTGSEGAITIDNVTGQVTTPPADRPEWAEGLYVASFGERNEFWQSRLGEKLPDSISSPEVYSFQDLQWYGIDGQTEVTILADNEYRMDKLAEVLDIDLESATLGDIDKHVTHAVTIEHQIAEPTDEITLREAEAAHNEGNVEQIGQEDNQKAVNA